MAEMTGQAIYDNFQEGVGTKGLVSGADQVNTVVPNYVERGFQIQRLIAEMEPLWQGAAAAGARHGAAPMLAGHSEIAEKFLTAQDLIGRQAGSFNDAKNKVMPVPAEPTEVQPWILASPGAMATYQQQVSQHNSAAQHNVDVMNGYTGASTYNTDNLPKAFDALADDQSGLSVAAPDGGGDSGPGSRGATPPPAPGPGPEPGGDTLAGPAGPDTRLPSDGDTSGATPGTTTPGTTTPSAHTPVTSGPSGAPLPAADPGRPGGLGPGVGGGLPIGSESGGRGGRGARGGGAGGAPRGGPVGGPVPHGGAEPHGQGSRATPAAGRGPGAGMGGVPVGAGRGRDEDTERKTPAYLEAGDPDDLYGTDLPAAPPVIGEEDDD